MQIMTPADLFTFLKQHIKKEWKVAFISTFLIGLAVHFPAFASDIPNHDGLASMYFDQNMITSGRWFLTIACGISSYFTLPWVIGLLSLVWISITSVILIELLEIKKTEWVVLLSGLLVSFPALASTYAYVFTADGYMLGLLFAVLSVLLTKKYRFGFLAGACCLAVSMGTYQSYLAFTILLCLYQVIMVMLTKEENKAKVKQILNYFAMGVAGAGLYYIILQVLLKIQGKELASYQGINSMTSLAESGIFLSIKRMYTDFFTFVLKGNILFNNVFSAAAILVIGVLVLITLAGLIKREKLWRSPWLYAGVVFLAVTIPLGANVILLISPSVNYHLLMRYQYVLLLILSVAFMIRMGAKTATRTNAIGQWLLLMGTIVLVGNFAVSDNIGYSNLEKRYEKTYAYCLRLADRMEQTEGYYTGMPVVMMGVVGDENFPSTDITEEVTGNMIGLCGDYLCYTGENYKSFFKNYLGITIEVVDQETVGEIYNTSELYHELDSFPGPHSMEVVDGVLYIKTENNLEEYN